MEGPDVTTLRRNVVRAVTDLGLAFVLTVVAFDSPAAYPAVVLAVKLNVFALPLAVAGVLVFPLWTWYVIGVLWSSQILFYFQVTVRDVMAGVQTRVAAPISLTDPSPRIEEDAGAD